MAEFGTDSIVTLADQSDTLVNYYEMGEHDYEVIPLDVAPGVPCLGTELSFVPSTDIRIASNILSASHMKLFSVAGNDYIVRIAAVMVGGQVRTRVVSELVGGTQHRVLEFNTGVDRNDCFFFNDRNHTPCVDDMSRTQAVGRVQEERP